METNEGSGYPLLFSPLRIGDLEIKNRLVMAPTVINFAHADGTPSDRQLDYYRMRAEGGVGLVIVEATYVRGDGRMFLHGLGLDEDFKISGLQKLVRAIRAGGACAGIQLFHAGRRANPEVIGGQPIGPSALPCPLRQVIPRELATEEIGELVQGFVQGARRAQEAGFDLICLHMAHGYFLHQFLSPLSNQRQDRYGKNFQGRLRLPLEVLQGVRARLGQKTLLSCRISAEEGGRGVWRYPIPARLPGS
jgi:2,4-dienoyl-CoA reductase-like NADH-dependent reductase (Old Yellow Enzyme family)